MPSWGASRARNYLSVFKKQTIGVPIRRMLRDVIGPQRPGKYTRTQKRPPKHLAITLVRARNKKTARPASTPVRPPSSPTQIK